MTQITVDRIAKEYFGERKEYIPGLPSYSSIRDASTKYTVSDLAIMGPDAPRENPFEEISDDIIGKMVELIGALYNATHEDISILEVYEMMNGRSHPLQIVSSIGGVKKRCYAKVPEASRFIGMELYNMLSGASPVDFIFNEVIYVDDAVPGTLLVDCDKEELFRNQNYLENLVRLDAVAEVMAINDLRINTHNTSIDSDGNICLFDFDEALKFRKETLIDGLSLPPKEIKEIREDELRLIARRAKKSNQQVSKLIELMRHSDYHENEAAQYPFNARNMGDVVAQHLRILGVHISGQMSLDLE